MSKGDDANGILQAVYDPTTNALRINGTGGSGAPTNASYITAVSEAGLSAETVFGTAVFYPPDVIANRPGAASTIVGAIFYATDTGLLYRSDGVSNWTTITSVGGGGADRLGLTPTAVKTANYTAAVGDFVPCDTATTGAFTVTLPTAPADGSVIAVKMIKQSSARTVTIATGGSDVFNVAGGATTGTLTLLNQGTILQYKSSSAIWYSAATDTPLTGLDGRYFQITNNLSEGTAAAMRTSLGLGAAALLADPITVAHGGSGATSLTGLVVGNGTSAFTTVTAPAGAVVGTTDTQTLTNKRNTKRLTSLSSSATPTINTDNTDVVLISALATNITSMTTNLSGTPNDFDQLLFRIKDNGTARTITWGASFISRGVTLPTTTVTSKVLYVGFVWNASASTWDCIASAQEA